MRSWVWIGGHRVGVGGGRIDWRDRGLHYGDGVFETMRFDAGGVRHLPLHLDRLYSGCEALGIAIAPRARIAAEIRRAVGEGGKAFGFGGVAKLIVTRGPGARGYRPSGTERSTRILSLYELPPAAADMAAGRAVKMRLCATRLGLNPALAGLKTLNRLESVLARTEWRDANVFEGLMRDTDENLISGTMSNLFVRRGHRIMTPLLNRCGVAGVMRRWVLEIAPALGLDPVERRLRLSDLARCEEVFVTNAVLGVCSVRQIQDRAARLRFHDFGAAARLRAALVP